MYDLKRARALYSDADIYLFDATLSAVDANVSKRLLNEYTKIYLSIYRYTI